LAQAVKAVKNKHSISGEQLRKIEFMVVTCFSVILR